MRRFDAAECKRIMERAGVKFRTGSVSFILPCDLCGKTKLYVRKSDGRSICFHCQELRKGWADYVLAPILGVPSKELSEVLYGAKGTHSTAFIDLEIADHYGDDEYGYEDEDVELEETLPEKYWPIGAYPLEHSFSGNGVYYLMKRGVPVQLAMQYDIRYIPSQRRVAFPVTQNGRMVGYQARAIDQDTTAPKMLTEGKVGGKALMFEQNLNDKHVIVTEGPFDALKCSLVGGWVATMGKGITPRQLELILAKKPKRVFLALDPDAASDTARVFKELTGAGVELFLVTPAPGYKDLGEMSAADVAAQVENATPLHLGYLFHYLRS